ncbi:FadR/GntR family transcriptional regulator [Neobacillus kokaensis]|uniref:GntR family transcriptional regulator n=1 Tax=Neobacillus kokaensis TaxID=2759023 RepID=A0ABQ3N533_9BACI|nr:FadR/GntR family transcriptional regulator [Neobacillus kokaensis]GHH99812.1 GntR family transcriptional regulator [Neobacillus kokaensis]
MKILNRKLLTLPEQIVEQIKESIVSGKLKKGDKLPSEQELADLFQVSRPTIRDAIKLLTASKLIVSRPGAKGGHFITDISPESFIYEFKNYISLSLVLKGFSIEELIDYRIVMETQTCGLAAIRRTEEDLKKLKNLLPDPTENLSDYEYFERDFEFHRAIATATHNSLIFVTMESIMDVLKPMFRLLSSTDEFKVQLARELQEIYEVIEYGDQRLAEKKMASHLEHFKQDFYLIGHKGLTI